MKSAIVLLLLCGPVLVAAPLPVGVIDTVGGTTYDDQNSGPALQWVVNDPAYGIHVTWMYANSATPWSDRTMQYNFYDKTTEAWNWLDPDFMVSGTNSQYRKTGFGTLELDPADGSARIACHYSAGMPGFTPVVVDDIAPGAGIFDESRGEPNLTDYFLPVIAMPQDQSLSLLLIRFAASDNLYYTRSTTWGEWNVPVWWNVTSAFGHNIVASRTSNKLLATWMSGNGADLAHAHLGHHPVKTYATHMARSRVLRADDASGIVTAGFRYNAEPGRSKIDECKEWPFVPDGMPVAYSWRGSFGSMTACRR